MNDRAKGQTILETELRVEPVKLAELERAIGTDSAGQTAALVPYFGPTIAGEGRLVEVLDLDFAKALLAGHAYEWSRPFVPGERLRVRVYVDDVYQRGPNSFAIVAAEFQDGAGAVVQRQRTTFIERGGE